MSEKDAVLYSAQNSVAFITLNRPDVKNAINSPMRSALLDCLERAIKEERVRCIVILAAGDSFGAGQDLNAVDDLQMDAIDFINNHIKPIILAIHHSPKPVVAAINGACAGVSASIALSCDLAVMGESAFFIWHFQI